MEKLYSIQETAEILGMSKETLRYYDRIGLVSPARKDNRYRMYSKKDIIGLMNIQIMRYADFSLDEIKGKVSFRRMEKGDSAYCEELATFLDAKNAETRKKINHLEKVSQLLTITAETLRDFNKESDQRLAEFARELYREIQGNEPGISTEGCEHHQD
jgi:DNA-binding transcriptional MerR regulator